MAGEASLVLRTPTAQPQTATSPGLAGGASGVHAQPHQDSPGLLRVLLTQGASNPEP
jgi:hypothetical protein